MDAHVQARTHRRPGASPSAHASLSCCFPVRFSSALWCILCCTTVTSSPPPWQITYMRRQHLRLPIPPAFTSSSLPSPTPVPTPSPAPTPAATDAVVLSSYDELGPESDSDAVATLQKRLMELGYFDYDEITTYYGTVTQSAVMLFQRAQGLPQTGIADADTQRALYSADAQKYQIKLGDKGSDVRSMQRRLTELGYYQDKDNGYFGVATQQAVLSFQKRNNISQTGVIDTDARNLLYSP